MKLSYSILFIPLSKNALRDVQYITETATFFKFRKTVSSQLIWAFGRDGGRDKFSAIAWKFST